MKPDDPARHTSEVTVPELPQRVLNTYARLWQLETWLRRLVYIELRALAGDRWVSKIRGAEKPKETDKRLSHMPTPEEDPLSYRTFLLRQARQIRDLVERRKPFYEPLVLALVDPSAPVPGGRRLDVGVGRTGFQRLSHPSPVSGVVLQ